MYTRKKSTPVIVRLENHTEMSKPILQPAISQLQKLKPAILPIYKPALQMVLLMTLWFPRIYPTILQRESPCEAPEAPLCCLKDWFINPLLIFINVVTYLLVDHFWRSCLWFICWWLVQSFIDMFLTNTISMSPNDSEQTGYWRLVR